MNTFHIILIISLISFSTCGFTAMCSAYIEGEDMEVKTLKTTDEIKVVLQKGT